MVRIAILDLYEGQPNQGMRCMREIINQWGEFHGLDVSWDEFDVRQKMEIPDLSYDIYLSSGGPGSPLESEGQPWENAYFDWIGQVQAWNENPLQENKKHVFFICHSFQMACRYFGIGKVTRRKSTAFGVFPVHVLLEGQLEPIFRGLKDPFYVVDSRDWQVTDPDFDKLSRMGAQVLCIEKYRPHVPYAQAVMGLRFNPWMIGTQFHPEADAEGMRMYLQQPDKKQNVIDNHGLDKWESMIEGLSAPDKIMWTYSHILPNFLTIAAHKQILQPM